MSSILVPGFQHDGNLKILTKKNSTPGALPIVGYTSPWQGRKLFHVRELYLNREHNLLAPSRDGVTFDPAQFDQFVKSLKEFKF